jgi:hypothetical protein
LYRFGPAFLCRRHYCTVSDRHIYAASRKGATEVDEGVKEVEEGVNEVEKGANEVKKGANEVEKGAR